LRRSACATCGPASPPPACGRGCAGCCCIAHFRRGTDQLFAAHATSLLVSRVCCSARARDPPALHAPSHT
jgi:hypothetical protein